MEIGKLMNLRKHILWVAAVLLVAVTLILFSRKPAPPDLSKDEEPFRSMVLPPKSVIGLCYMDGGSAAIYMIDKNGVEYEIIFPIDYDGVMNAHPTAYHKNITDPKTIGLKDPQRAKVIVLRLLKDYGIKDDEKYSTTSAIHELSEFYGIPARGLKRAKRWFVDTASNW